ncbi:MAG: winged helix-turn-helix domain-containing protein [Vulcanimicrobiaceae bacterium]
MQARVISIKDWVRRKPRAFGAVDHGGRRGALGLSTDQVASLAKALASELDRLSLIAPRQSHLEKRIVIGALDVDLEGYEATVNGTTVALKPREFALLKALAQNVGRVLSRDQLLELAWPDPQCVNSNRTVDVHIRRLRLKLGASGPICTVVGVGYKLVRIDHQGRKNASR